MKTAEAVAEREEMSSTMSDAACRDFCAFRKSDLGEGVGFSMAIVVVGEENEETRHFWLDDKKRRKIRNEKDDRRLHHSFAALPRV